jgi:hypothetical protein
VNKEKEKNKIIIIKQILSSVQARYIVLLLLFFLWAMAGFAQNITIMPTGADYSQKTVPSSKTANDFSGGVRAARSE